MSYGFKIVVEGDYACFTRPEMKVERVSYDVPTPSALCGLLKSIYWKPAIKYVIDKIIVFNPINFINIRRNEVRQKVSFSKLKKQMKCKNTDICIYTANPEFINLKEPSIYPRASMILKDVKYGIEFHFETTNIKSEDEVDGENKHYSIIKRRFEKGQFFRAPCLGCREFSAKSVSLVDDFDLSQIDENITKAGNVDLGFMLYEMKFEDKGLPINGDWGNPVFSDKASAIYYRPHMIGGVIDVQKYKEVIKCS